MANLPESPVWHDEIYRLEKRTLVVGGEPQFDEAGNPIGGYSNVPHKQMADRTQWLRERIGEKLQVVEDIDALRLVDPRLLYYGQFLSIVTYGSGQFNDGVVEYYYWDPVSQLPDDGYDVIKPDVPLVSGRWIRITNQTSDDIIEEMRQLLADSQAAAQQSLQYSQNAAQYAQQANQAAEQAGSYDILYQQYILETERNVDASEAWAESDTPPNPDDLTSKSSKSWAEVAQESVDTGILQMNDLIEDASEFALLSQQYSNESEVQAREAESSADRAEIAASDAQQYSNLLSFPTESLLHNSEPAEPGSRARVYSDSDPGKNGYWTAQLDGIYTFDNPQPLNKSDVNDLTESVYKSTKNTLSALEISRDYYTFHVTDIIPDYFNNSEIYVDKNNKIIGFVSSNADFHFQGINSTVPQEDNDLSQSKILYSFYTQETENYSFVQLSKSNKILNGWDKSGKYVDPNNGANPNPVESINLDAALLPYVDDVEDRIRLVGSQDYPSANLRGRPCLGVYASSDKHARAIIVDPFAGPQPFAVSPNLDYTLKSLEKTLFVIFGTGQSLITGARSGSSMISVNSLYPEDVFMFDTGATSDVRMGLQTGNGDAGQELVASSIVGLTPHVAKVGQGIGDSGETVLESLANSVQIIAKQMGVEFRTLSFTNGVGGAAYDLLKKGSLAYNNALVALQRCQDLIGMLGFDRIEVIAIPNKHGESEYSNPNYFDQLIEWQANYSEDIQSISGQRNPVPFIMSMLSSFYGDSRDSRTNSVKAMLRAHNESPYHHLSGCDYQWRASYFTDIQHMYGRGYFGIGEMMAKAIGDVCFSTRGKSRIVQMLDAERTGTLITATFSAPHALVFDTSSPTTRDYEGFRVRTSTGSVTPTDHEIVDDGATTGVATINFQLPSIPTGTNETFDYAMLGHSGSRSLETVPRGNLRDTDPRVSYLDGTPLYNWCVSQSIQTNIN